MAQLERVPEKQRSGDFYLARAQMFDAEGKPDDALADLQQQLRILAQHMLVMPMNHGQEEVIHFPKVSFNAADHRRTIGIT
ncbi:MAG: hypothetical protein WCB11_14050, partial [Terriglobales bacterium]